MLYRRVIKRIFDFCLSLLAIVVLSPLFVILIIAVFINDGLPIFYTQDRLGYKGRKFKIFKFRTMINNADKIGALHTDPQDKRVTKIGHILRKFSLDELPQLLNILIGDMSIVGNRPDIYAEYESLSDYQKKRVELKPGLTGLSAIRGRSLLSREQRMKNDLEYIDRCNFILDVYIVFKTVGIVFTHKGVNSDITK